MLGALVRRHAHTPGVRESVIGPRRAVQLARAYLEDNHAANVSLLELEQVAALSPFHLARLFQQEVGHLPTPTRSRYASPTLSGCSSEGCP